MLVSFFLASSDDSGIRSDIGSRRPGAMRMLRRNRKGIAALS